MFGKRVFSIALVGIAVLAVDARAQDAPASSPQPLSLPPANACTAEPGKPPCVRLDSAASSEVPADAWRVEASPGFTLFGNIKSFSRAQTDTAKTTASFGQTWRLKTGLRYEAAGGVQLSAGAVGRRGYSLPLSMVEAPGSDTQLADPRNAALGFGSAPIRWDTELRIRKELTSKGPVDMAIVGEAINLLNVNQDATLTTPSDAMLNSRTFRVAIVLGF